MRTKRAWFRVGRFAVIAVLLVITWSCSAGSNLQAKDKKNEVDPNDCTCRLFQFLDDSRGGKLDGFYALGDVYQDPKSGEEFRHVFKVEYDRGKAFGRLKIYVRAVGKMSAQQLSTYTPQQIYDFGESDLEKFVKTDCGQYGKAGDLYLQPNEDGPLATSPITEEARKRYDSFLCQYVLPALQKK
ncbi:MAG TPA: hypothetical protein VKM93_17550 [Terriglobia bacterium]|nr:hypothetical protein [Terriglobia bacterium]